MSRAKKKGTIMDGSFENEVPPPAVDGTDSAIPSSGLDVLFNKKGAVSYTHLTLPTNSRV